MELVIDNRQDKVNIDDNIFTILEKVAKESLLYEGWDEDYEISLSFVDNKEIKGLNKYYRGKDSVTDVLSFPMVDEDTPMMGEKILGDIVISVEKALEQSKEYGHSFLREMAFLTAHSMLHLMGYDHMNEDEEEEMQMKQEAILSKLEIKRI